MAKTGYSTWWVPQETADLAVLLAQHQRCFPGNALAVVNGHVKVSVLDGEVPPAAAKTKDRAIELSAVAGNVPV